MTFDPFADGDTPEESTDGQWDDSSGEQTTVTTTAVTPNGEHKVRVTLKAGAGYEAPWITIDGTDVKDAADQLGGTDGVRRLVELTVSAAKFLHRSYGPNQQRSQSNGSGSNHRSGQRQTGKPKGATEAPDGTTMRCDHGLRIYASGFSERTGKTWGAFDCPKGECGREWHNPKRR